MTFELKDYNTKIHLPRTSASLSIRLSIKRTICSTTNKTMVIDVEL
jgi:hypothetical protein